MKERRIIPIEKRNPQDVLMEIDLLQTALYRSLQALDSGDPEDIRFAKEMSKVALRASEAASGYLGLEAISQDQHGKTKFIF